MAHNLSREAERYLARAEQALEAARTLAEHGYPADALSKAYYGDGSLRCDIDEIFVG